MISMTNFVGSGKFSAGCVERLEQKSCCRGKRTAQRLLVRINRPKEQSIYFQTLPKPNSAISRRQERSVVGDDGEEGVGQDGPARLNSGESTWEKKLTKKSEVDNVLPRGSGEDDSQ